MKPLDFFRCHLRRAVDRASTEIVKHPELAQRAGQVIVAATLLGGQLTSASAPPPTKPWTDGGEWGTRAQAALIAADQQYPDGFGLYGAVDWRQRLGTLDPSQWKKLPINFVYKDLPANNWAMGQLWVGALDVAKETGDYSEADRIQAQLEMGLQTDGSYAPNVAAPTLFGHQLFHETAGFDDNAWIGLGYMQLYAQRCRPEDLQKALAVVKFLKTGQDPRTGALYWEQSLDGENVPANGPSIELALLAYHYTHDASYLTFARQMYDFVDGHLKAPDGLYSYAYFHDTNRIEKSFPPFSYDQGTMIRSELLLYQITGDRTYLDKAVQTANAAIALWGKGQADGFWRQRPRYNAIFFRELMQLDQVAPNPAYRQALEAYAQRLANARDPVTGLYTRGTPGPSGAVPEGFDPTDQGAAAQIFFLVWAKGPALSGVT